MNLTSTQMTIAEYCDQLQSNSIIINRDYQRSPKRWPPAARSFLIDTILQGYPIPKIILAQQTDLASRRTRKEVVDGQQRSMAISDFYRNRLTISGDSDFAGKTFSDLDEPKQQAFVDYALGIDILTGADNADIRQMFRRMNSYTVPLNPQEQRYATHQGPVKWVVFEQSGVYAEMFKAIGVFGEKQISSMQDGLLITELAFAIVNGLKTTNKRMLDKFYGDREAGFPEQQIVSMALREGFDFILAMPDIHGSELMKPYQLYCLTLAAAHAKQCIDALTPHYMFPPNFAPNPQAVAPALGSLALALAGDVPPELGEFVNASTKATNTAKNRQTRFLFFCNALQGTLGQ
jgi:hypothetical protein